MKLNCKEGDLAVIVRSTAGNEGKIVRCVRLRGLKPQAYPDRVELAPSWEVDRPLVGWNGTVGNNIEDSRLRPIRDDDGEDEMLRIAGVPARKLKTTNADVTGLAPRKD